MNDNLLLHPKTREQFDRLADAPPHAILISGITGSGKQTLAMALAATVLQTDPGTLDTHPYLFSIEEETDAIPIESIRSLQQFLKLKVPGRRTGINRIILIPQAERMRSEAQNALLKTLEEPPADTCIILTAESQDALLPTITSRSTELAILPVGSQQASEFYARLGKKSADISRYIALSQGQAGLLHSLFYEESHSLLLQVELAKAILAEKPGQRLYRTDELTKDKPAIKLLLNALMRISHAALYTAAARQHETGVKRWNTTLNLVLETSKHLKYNASPKLLLDNLFLQM